VAKRFHVTVAALVAANHIKDPNKVEAGQRLVLPRPVPAPKATTTTLSPG
jgi:LysM repeat protein